MDIKEQLEVLTSEIKSQTTEQRELAIKAFEVKNKEFMTAEIKTAVDAVKAENKEVTEGMQKHLDTLDLKLQNKDKQNAIQGDSIKAAIKENFKTIETVAKGHSIDVKAVGDMTLPVNLTGDQPRDYNFDVVMTPGQLVNFSDLTGSVSISGGTYTFPRETGTEGSISAQTEGASKSQIDYDLTMVDVNTDFIAGFSRYSRKMRNNLPFLESFVPKALRRDYMIAENASFNTVLAAAATASTQIITGKNKIEMLINEIATLEDANFPTTSVVLRPSDFWDILKTEKSTGAGYGLPGVVTFDGGQLRINGIPLFRATWVAANKYYVGDWSRINKVITEGLSLNFSEEEGTNFVKNMITARIESQVALAVEQPAAIVIGDFTAI